MRGGELREERGVSDEETGKEREEGRKRTSFDSGSSGMLVPTSDSTPLGFLV